MTTKLSVEKSTSGDLLCSLDFFNMGNGQAIRLTMELPQGPDRTISQIELEVMQKAHSLLGEMCRTHHANKPKSA